MSHIEWISHNEGFVPIINGHLMHSLKSPMREASLLYEKYLEHFSQVKSVIVMGVGGGFHIEALKKSGIKNIAVIEHNQTLCRQLKEKNPKFIETVELYSSLSAQELFSHKKFTQFFKSSFFILKHTPSVRLNFQYYQDIQRSLTTRTLHALRDLSQANQKLQTLFDSLDISSEQTLTLPMVTEALQRQKGHINQEAMIWMTLRELIV